MEARDLQPEFGNVVGFTNRGAGHTARICKRGQKAKRTSGKLPHSNNKKTSKRKEETHVDSSKGGGMWKPSCGEVRYGSENTRH